MIILNNILSGRPLCCTNHECVHLRLQLGGVYRRQSDIVVRGSRHPDPNPDHVVCVPSTRQESHVRPPEDPIPPHPAQIPLRPCLLRQLHCEQDSGGFVYPLNYYLFYLFIYQNSSYAAQYLFSSYTSKFEIKQRPNHAGPALALDSNHTKQMRWAVIYVDTFQWAANLENLSQRGRHYLILPIGPSIV